MPNSSGGLTELLLSWGDGNDSAREALLPLVYEDLRQIARGYLRRERPGHTLQTTDLINEAYIRLVDHKGMRWQNRAHFYAVAAQAMRRILVDHARSRSYLKRGGDKRRVTLDEVTDLAQDKAAEMIRLDDALTQLTFLDPRKSKVVELRYFGGMSVEETAEVLGISPVTVMREWRTAKGWLLRAMSPEAK